jgi:hypothetical protein
MKEIQIFVPDQALKDVNDILNQMLMKCYEMLTK